MKDYTPPKTCKPDVPVDPTKIGLELTPIEIILIVGVVTIVILTIAKLIIFY